MKTLLLALISIVSLNAFAAAEWKVVSETENCPHKIQIKAKDGEKYVIAVNGKKEEKLFSSNGAGYDANTMNATEYMTDNKNKSKDAVSYSFIQPSYVENRPAKLEIAQNGNMIRCPLVVK